MKFMIEKLLKNQLFKNMKIEEVEAISEKIRFYKTIYKKGDIIAHEEDECTSIGLILEGSVQIERIYSNGNGIILQTLRKGNVFGEALVFSSFRSYPATVVAAENCEIVFIKRSEMLNLCLSEERILENFTALLSDKIFMLNAKVKSISFKSLKERVINFIIEKSREQNSLNIKLKGSKEAIAQYLGMPRPSFSRELIKLRDEGIISFDRNSIKILDFELLEGKLFE
ncbi:MAG: Crp/Fnr family transcriptional regulator [Clostridium sp.]|nr:Crp/Fnr family transcriptional regulator [Clostridium sp.]